MTPRAAHAAGHCTPDCAAECAGVASFARLTPWTINLLCESRTMQDAWAWRCADTLPDSAQSRRDSLADAETLALYYGQRTSAQAEWAFDLLVAQGHGDMARRSGDPEWAGIFARRAASAAFRAVPGLRGAL